MYNQFPYFSVKSACKLFYLFFFNSNIYDDLDLLNTTKRVFILKKSYKYKAKGKTSEELLAT